MDLNTNLRRSEIRDTIIKKDAKKNKDKNDLEDINIPEPTSLDLKAPDKISIKDAFNSQKNVSFSSNDQVPLRDLLIEIGRIANVDVEIDPTISGGVILTANNKPLGEVIERIVKLGNLRYKFENDILHFERDSAYTKNYIVDYLTEGSSLWTEVQNNITAIMDNDSSVNVTTSQEQSSNAANTSITTKKGSVTINKSAGIMSVFATQKQHLEIEKYLKDVERNASAQVIIEAKVVEVALKDEFQAGINWSWLSGNGFQLSSNNNYQAGKALDFVVGTTANPKQLFGGSITSTVSALEEFGTTRTLSSPRIHAINNQKAVLNFTDKLIYFKIENNQATTNTNIAVTTQTITSTKQEENVGVELNITPSINLKTNEITLFIKPKITVKSGEVVDPASPKVGNEIIQNKVPIIQTRELNTVAKIQNGNIIVIGGLMKESAVNTDNGIPFLQRIPILGYLFKSSSKKTELVETVIFIKATILNSSSQVDEVDKDFHKKFDPSKRKFF